MKKINLRLVVTLCIALFSFTGFAQTGFPWKSSEVIQPAELAKKIKSTNKNQFTILNIGPVDNILYAEKVGAVADPKIHTQLMSKLKKMDKNKEVIFYCGCCAMNNCPNIVPTYEALKKMGFKNIKVLNIEESIYDDWISKDYPMP